VMMLPMGVINRKAPMKLTHVSLSRGGCCRHGFDNPPNRVSCNTKHVLYIGWYCSLHANMRIVAQLVARIHEELQDLSCATKKQDSLHKFGDILLRAGVVAKWVKPHSGSNSKEKYTTLSYNHSGDMTDRILAVLQELAELLPEAGSLRGQYHGREMVVAVMQAYHAFAVLQRKQFLSQAEKVEGGTLAREFLHRYALP
jgi:hypothetical protein